MLIFSLCKLYSILNIYQQAHYHIKEYLVYYLKNTFYYFFIPLVLYSFKYIPFCYYLGYILVNCYSILFLFFKVRLKLTKRVIRVILFSLAPLAFVIIFDFLALILEYVMIVIFIIDILIANKLNKKYYKKAMLKLKDYAGKTIGITGSCGKTTTKDFFYTLLSNYYRVLKTPNNFNTPIGIALTVNNNVLDYYDYLIFEMGVSHINDMDELLTIYKPRVAVITEITTMHMDGFKNISNILKEKMKIIKYADVVIINYENSYLRNYPINNKYVLSYGFSYGILRAVNITDRTFDLYYKDRFIYKINYSFTGRHNILNALAIIAYLLFINKDIKEAARAVMLINNSNSRLVKTKYKNHLILDDSYNSNPLGFKEALNSIKSSSDIRILITPGFVELGSARKAINQEIAIAIAASIDVVILVMKGDSNILYKLLRNYNIELYRVRSFKEAYQLYKRLRGYYSSSSLLIENDLPDIYMKGLIRC